MEAHGLARIIGRIGGQADWISHFSSRKESKMAVSQDFARVDLSVKPYLGSGAQEMHLESIVRLWRERFDEDHIEKRQILFRWLTERNPFREGRTPYYLLTHGGQVVGMHGHMPLRFSLRGRQMTGYLAHDDLLAKAYRGKGLGKVLLRGVAEQTTDFAGALWFNEPNRHLYLKAGWLPVPDFYPYFKILDPAPFIRQRVGGRISRTTLSLLARSALRVGELALRARIPRRIAIIPMMHFDERFDEFFSRVSPAFGLMVVRDHWYLNWKFVERPFSNYRRYAAFNNQDTLCGYAVIKRAKTGDRLRGQILDILADPREPEAFEGLLNQCLQDFKRSGVDCAEIMCTYPPFIRQLRRAGFLRARTPEPFMACKWEQQFERSFVSSIGNWYLTFGDADGDAWDVNSPEPW
jgi:GNAT superfamily N-acetyltransferase